MPEVIHTVDLVRHAHSQMNGMQADPDIPPFIGGRQNQVPLDDLGVMQSIALGLALGREGYTPTMVLASPAERTLETCRLSTLSLFGGSREPIIVPDFQELDQGDWTNQPRTLYDKPDVKERMRRLGWDFAPPKGESMDMVANRMWWRLGELAVELDASPTPQHVIAFTHGVAIKNAVGRRLAWTHDQTYRTAIDNVSRTRLVYTKAGWEVRQVNERLIPEKLLHTPHTKR